MKARIAVLFLAIAFFGSPALGAVVSAACSQPCVTEPVDGPCEPGPMRCASLAAATCCNVTPAATQAKRSSESSTLQPVALVLWSSEPVPMRARAPRAAADLALRSSPLRLSVVRVL